MRHLSATKGRDLEAQWKYFLFEIFEDRSCNFENTVTIATWNYNIFSIRLLTHAVN